MTSDQSELRRARATFFETLDSEFRELASTAGLRTRDGQASVFVQQGLLIAVTASLGEREEDGQNIGLLHISTPNDRPLPIAEGVEVPPGSYVMHLRDGGVLVLRDAAGQAVAETPVPDAAIAEQSGGGGLPTCNSKEGIRFEISVGTIEICLLMVCPGIWVVVVTDVGATG